MTPSTFTDLDSINDFIDNTDIGTNAIAYVRKNIMKLVNDDKLDISLQLKKENFIFTEKYILSLNGRECLRVDISSFSDYRAHFPSPVVNPDTRIQFNKCLNKISDTLDNGITNSIKNFLSKIMNTVETNFLYCVDDCDVSYIFTFSNLRNYETFTIEVY